MKHDGGPAFPAVQSPLSDPLAQDWKPQVFDPITQDWKPRGGMSLRDFFAAQFLPSVALEIADRLAAPDEPSWYEREGDDKTFAVPPAEIAARIARAAYLIADAMLMERAQAQP